MKKRIYPYSQEGDFYHQYKLSELKYDLRKKRLIPIVKDNCLYIYKVSTNRLEFLQMMKRLSQYYKEYYYILIDRKQHEDHYRGVKLNGLDSIESVRLPLRKDIISHYNLNSKDKMINFIKDYSENKGSIDLSSDSILNSSVNYQFNEVVEQQIAKKLVAQVRREPKLYQLMYITMFDADPDLFLEFIAKQLCEFIYDKKIDFTTGQNNFHFILWEVNNINYNHSEINLSLEEKSNLLKNLYHTLNIECIYERTCKNINDNDFYTISPRLKKDSIIEIAKHNSYILYDSLFSPIYMKMKDEKYKVKELDFEK